MSVHIHLVRPGLATGDLRLLSEEDRGRAASFRFEKDATHWIACRTALRVILGRLTALPPAGVPLLSGPNGKPALATPFEGIHFNVTHCDDLALIAVAPFPVGIDVERWDRGRDLIGCEETFCHPDEIGHLPAETSARATALLNIWTAKEAALKARGSGLLSPPQELAVDFSGNPATARSAEDATVQRIFGLDHPALVAHSAYLSSAESSPDILYHWYP